MSSSSTTWTTDTNTKSGTVQIYDSSVSTLRITAGESTDAILELFADEGDDNADKWRLWVNDADDDLHFANYTSGSWADLLTIQDGGNVGIGTDSPGYKLEVAGTSLFGTTGAGAILMLNGESGLSQRWDLSTTVVAGLQFISNTSPKMTILDTGNVGIGTVSPDFRLEVEGSANDSTRVLSIKNTAAGGADSGGVVQMFQSDGAVCADGDRLGVITFTGTEDATVQKTGALIQAICDDAWTSTGTYDHATRLEFAVQSGVSGTDAASTPSMIIDSAGFVGISTTSPDNFIEIAHGLDTAVTPANIFNNIIKGIHISKSDHADGAGSMLKFSADGDTNQAAIAHIAANTNGDSSLAFYTSDADDAIIQAMVIDWSQNVGIGVASPSQKLQVTETTHGSNVVLRLTAENDAGTTKEGQVMVDPDAEILILTGRSGTNPDLVVKGDGKVGIGTASPDSEAHDSSTVLHVHMEGAYPAVLNLTGGSGANGETIGEIHFSDPDNTDSTLAFIRGYADGTDATHTGGSMSFWTQADAGASTQRMIIGQTGQVGIGIAAPTNKLHVEDTADSSYVVRIKNASTNVAADVLHLVNAYSGNPDTTNSYIDFSDADAVLDQLRGDGSGGVAETWTDSSDVRIKENIENLTGGLDKINALRPVQYDYTADYIAGKLNKISAKDRWNYIKYGFIAQEFESHFPINIQTCKEYIQEDGIVYGGTTYNKGDIIEIKKIDVKNNQIFQAYLVKAIQELSAKVTALENA